MPRTKEDIEEKVLELLPAPISKIEVQKKRAHRYSLFVKDTFIIGVSEYTLVNLNLSKGASLTSALLDQIIANEDYHAARDYILRLLGRRDHSKSELKLKGLKKGYPKQLLESIVNELEEKGYVNDEAFAIAFTKDKINAGKWGSNKIGIALSQKGISKEIIGLCKRIIEEEQDVEHFIFTTVEKNIRKFKRVEDTHKRKAKIYSFLLQRGFPSHHVSPHLNRLLKLVES